MADADLLRELDSFRVHGVRKLPARSAIIYLNTEAVHMNVV